MRYLVFSFIVGLLSICCWADNNTSIKGTVNNAGAEDTVRIVIDTTYLGFNELRYKKGLDKGDFSYEFDLKDNAIVYLVVNKEKIPLYVEPGDELELTFDKESLKSDITFAGKGGPNNEFFHKFNQEFAEQLNIYQAEDQMKAEILDIFEMNAFDANKAQEQYVKDNLDKMVQSRDFQKFMQHQIRYNYLGRLLAYPIVRANNQTTKLDVDPLPRVMMDVLKPEWINNDPAMLSDWYRYFVEHYVVYKTSEINDFKKFRDYTKSVDSKYVYARQNIEGEPFKYFLAKYLRENYEKIKPSSVRWLYNHLAEEDEHNKYKAEIEKICEQRMSEEDPVEEVAEAPKNENKNAIMKDLEGNGVTFDDFRGKVVYVDFWASWCGPCRKQFPHAKELKAKLMDELSKKEKEKIVFLYISIDDTEQGWKGAVEKLGMEGFQAHSPGGWNSKIVKQFQISGIPRYMLINKKGKFVEMNAKRPSDPTILDDLLELIRE